MSIAITSMMWICGAFFEPILILSFVVPCALLLAKSRVLDIETKCKQQAQNKIIGLRFFEHCILDNRDGNGNYCCKGISL